MTADSATGRAARSQRTRRALLRSARELMLTHGYDRTSIDDIATGAGFTYGALHTYYQHKHELGHAVADGVTCHILARLQRYHPAETTELVNALARWAHLMITHPGWIRLECALAAHSDDDAARVQQRTDSIRTALAHLLAATIRPSPAPEALHTSAHVLVSALVGYTTLHPRGHVPDRDHIRAQIDCVLVPLTHQQHP